MTLHNEPRTLTAADLIKMPMVTLDVATLTLGEAAEAERESGWSIGDIARSKSAMRVLAMFIHGLRHYDIRPSWSELSNLRVLDVPSLTSTASGSGASGTSKD